MFADGDDSKLQPRPLVYNMAGQEVMRSSLFSHFISQLYRPRVCDFCLDFKDDDCTTKKCFGCRIVHYCNKDCQKKAWRSAHRKECSVFAKISSLFKEVGNIINEDEVFHIARIILKLKNGGSEEFERLPDGRHRYFKDLMSHRENFSNELREEISIFWFICKTSLEENDLDAPTESELQEIFGKIKINGNSLEYFKNAFITYGTGLFLGASAIDHSWYLKKYCRNNTRLRVSLLAIFFVQGWILLPQLLNVFFDKLF